MIAIAKRRGMKRSSGFIVEDSSDFAQNELGQWFNDDDDDDDDERRQANEADKLAETESWKWVNFGCAKKKQKREFEKCNERATIGRECWRVLQLRNRQWALLLFAVSLQISAPLQEARAQSQAAPPQVFFAAPPPQPQPPPPSQVITVAGNEGLMRHASRVDQIIMPYENFTIQSSVEEFVATNSYVIDHKRFVEPYASRCLSSTVLEDPDAFEPSFVIIKPGSERRVNATVPMELIQLAGFEPRQRTTVFVHGFTQSYPETEWLRRVRALLEQHALLGQQNVIIMDWGVASHGSYGQVAARASAMGSFLANFLMKLVDLGADRASFHLVGHSLGAHVAGFAGKRMRPLKVGRITALDAAGPCFGKLFSNSPTDRLAPDDAYEVDVYHYDDAFLGLSGQHGHWDVYVNGGSSQPGCKDNVNSMLQAALTVVFRRNRALSESHSRSTEVLSVSLAHHQCQQVAYECRDWPSFVAGECGQCDEQNSQCFFMGFPFQYDNMGPLPLRQTSSPGKRLYIATSSSEVFCLQHHQILVRFEPSSEQAQRAKRHRWRLHLELMDEQGRRVNVTMSHQLAPNVFSHLYLSDQRPARFNAALLQVRTSSDNSIVPLRQQDNHLKDPRFDSNSGAAQPSLKVNSIEVNFMSQINPQKRRQMSSRLCPVGWLPALARGSAPNENSIATEDPLEDWLGFEECNGANYLGRFTL